MAGPDISIVANLRFSVAVPDGPAVSGTIVGHGKALELRLDDPVAFAGRGDARAVRTVADVLAGYGLTMSVLSQDRPLLELGATRAGWLHSRLTGSRHLRVVGVRGLIAGARGQARGGETVLPGRALVPPPTLFPIVPTFGAQRRSPTTTHDPRQGGNPRLVLTVGNQRLPDSGKVIYPLGSVTRIGSDASNDIVLTGLAPEHAEVRRNADDELVIRDLVHRGSTRVNGVPVEERALRTGARVELGDWTLAYRRAEYADHGRPFGGRIGGELGHQKPQPGRHRAPERDQGR